MKRLMRILTVLCTYTLFTPAIFSQVPLSWNRDEINPGEDFTLMPEESFFTEGTRSCHMQLNTGAIPYLESDVFYISPGATYEFSFDVLDNDTAGQVKVYADFYDTYGFEIFGQPPVFSRDSSDWQTISWEGVVPGQAVVGYVLIKFYNQPNPYTFTRTAHIWLDNFQFREAGGINLVSNGGFEEWQVGVDEVPVKAGMISVYPNPAIDILNIKMEDEAETIIIADITGREVMKIKAGGKGVFSLDISILPEGLYLIKARLRNNSIIVQKLIIA